MHHYDALGAGEWEGNRREKDSTRFALSLFFEIFSYKIVTEMPAANKTVFVPGYFYFLKKKLVF